MKEIQEIIQSGRINFLIGSGASYPFLPLLNNIEKDLNEASTDKEREPIIKEYFKEVMIPNKEIIDGTLTSTKKYLDTHNAYVEFFQSLCTILQKRKSTILNKQINVFTTNIDILMEHALEKIQLEYNDGFSGSFNPIFGLENFRKRIFQSSLHFEHSSEIPVFNIIKIHGSLNWKLNQDKSKIVYARNLEIINKALLTKTGKDFRELYDEILVVNPESKKHLDSVLIEYYSELIRMYSSELEKENSILFTIGFSMADSHIKQITLRAAKSNPTLKIFIACSKGSESKMEKLLETHINKNIEIITPEDPKLKFTLKYFTSSILNDSLSHED